MIHNVTIRFSLKSVAAVAVLLALMWAALGLPHLLVEVFVACVIASALLPGVRYLEGRYHWPRRVAAIAMFSCVAGVALLLGLLVLPSLVEQLGSLVTALPEANAKLLGQYTALRGHGGAWRYLPPASKVMSEGSHQVSAMLGQGLGFARQTLTAVSALAIVLVLSFFLLFDGQHLRKGGLAMVPPRYRAIVDQQIDPVAMKLGCYVQGTMISIGSFILFQGIALTLVGLPLALGVAVIAGLLELIPLLGTAVGVSLGVVLGATVSGRMAFTVLAIFVVGRLIQDNLINPYVFSKSLELPPTMVILALLLGAELMGLEGALIAVPLLATVQVLVQNLYMEPLAQTEQALPDEMPHLSVTFIPEDVQLPEPQDRP
ncbi:MAG: tqsA [Cyanobacteria bacterium RYN_339]|nr:tqsA [Cyanobacteria bacterium RYN_339]